MPPHDQDESREPVLTRGRRSALGEIWAFLWARKLYWITPIIITLLLLGVLIAIGGGGSVLSPFIYAL